MTDANPGDGSLAVYIHIPFCERKCHYCDFNSGVHGPEIRERYVRALIREIESYAPAGRIVCSVFVGGGTPSVLPASSLLHILNAVRGMFEFAPDPEITVECNPGTVASERMAGETTESFLRGLRDAGVNRLSFGVQALDNSLLERLGRIHSPEQALQSISSAQAVGFENINVDLMFALPGQTSRMWDSTLSRVIATGVPHVSAYSLIVEPETPFAQWDAMGNLARPGNDEEATMYESAINTLQAAGYDHYEVSAFAKPGCRSAHNTVYWRNQEYIGFGNGAASYVAGNRFTREPNLERYVHLAENGDDTTAASEHLDERGAMGETMMMGLRLLDGVARADFAARFGCDPVSAFEGEIAGLVKAGLLTVTLKSVRLTRRGLFLANEVWEEFV